MPEKVLKQTPVVELQWCKLLGDPRPAYEPEKPPEWSIEILLDNDNEEHMKWVDEVEQEFIAHHGEGAKKSANWCPVKPFKEDPRKRMSCRLKLKQFDLRGGGKSEGPTVYDENGGFWDHNKLIGNGSKGQLSYTIYAWGQNSSTGRGISLEVRGAQVLEWLAAPEKLQAVTASDHGFKSTKENDAKAMERKANPVMGASVPDDPTDEDGDELPF